VGEEWRARGVAAVARGEVDEDGEGEGEDVDPCREWDDDGVGEAWETVVRSGASGGSWAVHRRR
jgi:hypothetical protein